MTAFVVTFRAEQAARRLLAALGRWLRPRQHPDLPPFRVPFQLPPEAALEESTVILRAFRVPSYVDGVPVRWAP